MLVLLINLFVFCFFFGFGLLQLFVLLVNVLSLFLYCSNHSWNTVLVSRGVTMGAPLFYSYILIYMLKNLLPPPRSQILEPPTSPATPVYWSLLTPWLIWQSNRYYICFKSLYKYLWHKVFNFTAVLGRGGDIAPCPSPYRIIFSLLHAEFCKIELLALPLN